MKTIMARVEYIKRINGSVNGNPNYEIGLEEYNAETDEWTFVRRRTQSDISDSYGIIPNQVKENATIYYTLTRAGRISSVEKVSA